MKNTTLCYIENNGKYLLIHRGNKKNDGSQGKYMGVGGHFEEKESPYDCAIREVKEETGLDIIPKYRAIVTFISDKYETEQMHLFTATEFSGSLIKTDEGELHWIDKKEVPLLNMWNGDLVFLKMLESENEFFSLKLMYHGEELYEYYINGKKA